MNSTSSTRSFKSETVAFSSTVTTKVRSRERTKIWGITKGFLVVQTWFQRQGADSRIVPRYLYLMDLNFPATHMTVSSRDLFSAWGRRLHTVYDDTKAVSSLFGLDWSNGMEGKGMEWKGMEGNGREGNCHRERRERMSNIPGVSHEVMTMNIAKFSFDIDLKDLGYDTDTSADTESNPHDTSSVSEVACGTSTSEENPQENQYEPTESDVISIKMELEKKADAAAARRHAEWLRHRQTLEKAIQDMFEEHLEIYEKAQALRMHFEAEQHAWTQKVNSMIGSSPGTAMHKRPHAHCLDDWEEFPYELPGDSGQHPMPPSAFSPVDRLHMAPCDTPPSVPKKVQKRFHTPFKST